MKIILIERLANLGNIGDTVTVKDGYARNFLIPQKKALRATKDNIAYFEAKRAEIEARNADQQKKSEVVAKGLDNLVVTLIRAASDDGRLFGSVTARDIAVAIQEKKHQVERNHIELISPLKEIGIYQVKVALHAEVVVTIKVNIARSESEAEAALKDSNAPKKGKAKSAVETLEESDVDAAEVAATDEESAA